jgi:lipopolysaccharide export system permease protein
LKIVDRYVLREFLGYLALGLIGFIVIFVVVDIFQKIDVFLDHHAPLHTVARFYLYLAPDVVVQVLPVALLLASFLSLGQLNKFGELTAMRAAGISLVRLLAPVFGVATVATFVSLLLGELVVPRVTLERDTIYDEQIQGIHKPQITERADITYLGEGGRIYAVRLYQVRERRMREVSMMEFKSGSLSRRVDAEDATWDGHQWVYSRGIMRTFDANGQEHAQPFDHLTIDGIRERPEDFAKETRQPEQMNFFELQAYLHKLRASGARVANYLVDLHLKLAFPLINMIVVMIGAPMATRLRLQSAAVGFGLSVAISFVYYAFMRTGQALGHNGALPPYIAAWLGDIVFGAIGATMLAQAQRT